MANLSPPPKLQFFDANGVPLVGGKLYSYAAGTTTPLATYTSSAETTFNTNPIILNSRGEAEVWLGSPLYKFKLTTTADVEIWTVDNIGSITSLQLATGASKIGYKFPANLTVVRSVQTVLQEGLSIGDFDSSPNLNNGVYDATLAMQRLAAECAANGFVGKLPAGKFSISGQVTFDEQSSAVVSDRRGSLRGAGIAQTEIKAQSNGVYAALDFLGSVTSGGIGLGIKPGGFMLSGPETNVGIGIQVDQYAFWSMDEIFVRGFDIGINAIDCLSVQMANLFIRNNRRGLLAFFENFSRPNAWTLTNVDFGLNTEFAASIVEPALFSFDGGAVQGNGIGGVGTFGYRGGILMTNAGTEGAVGGNFRNVYFEYNAGDSDVTLSAGTQTAVHNFYGCNFMRLNSTDFVTNNIKVDVGGTAFNIVNIDGCGFEQAGSYTPSAGRPYVNVAAINGAVNDMGNNYYQSDTEYVDLIKFGLGTRSGSIPASGTGATLPRGWSAVKTSTGLYTVTHSLNLAATAYRVSAVSVDASANVVQRVVKGTNTFQIVTTDVAGTVTDCATDFILTKGG
jgi:hypothetical protein